MAGGRSCYSVPTTSSDSCHCLYVFVSENHRLKRFFSTESGQTGETGVVKFETILGMCDNRAATCQPGGR